MSIALTGLLKIELPNYTIRLCDGGFSIYEGETYTSEDPLFGTLAAMQPLVEGFGDSIPALTLTLLPPNASAVSDLAKPGYQTARARFYVAEFDVATGVISAADLQFDGQVDQISVTVAGRSRTVEMSIVSLAERLFEGNIGNTMNPTFHKSVWPDETGHDQATGLSIPVAWGTESPPSGGYRGGGSSFGGGRMFVDNRAREL